MFFRSPHVIPIPLCLDAQTHLLPLSACCIARRTTPAPTATAARPLGSLPPAIPSPSSPLGVLQQTHPGAPMCPTPLFPLITAAPSASQCPDHPLLAQEVPTCDAGRRGSPFTARVARLQDQPRTFSFCHCLSFWMRSRLAPNLLSRRKLCISNHTSKAARPGQAACTLPPAARSQLSAA